ncbi:hypothetical protein PAMA_014073 [Pampus argenteus]
MNLLVVLMCLLAGCWAEKKPHPCSSPPLLSGSVTVTTQNEKMWIYGQYLYDAQEQRIRINEIGNFRNVPYTKDSLLLYKENRTCTKWPLKQDFQPMVIPKDASLMDQVFLGSSSAPGEGLLVNTWTGELPGNSGKYLSTVTELDCIPVSNVYKTKEFGWMLTSFFDNVLGISDPDQFIPPDFCSDVEMKADQEPVDFFSLFQNIY